MGKLNVISQRENCSDDSAPICAQECCNSPSFLEKFLVVSKDANAASIENAANSSVDVDPAIEDVDSVIKELLIIGAGPHSLALLLRLLEPDADLLSDKERHLQALFRSKMRPISDVYSHIEKLQRGPSATLKQSKKKSKKNKKQSARTDIPPPLSLDAVRESVLVVDKHGEWLSGWKQNFQGLDIPKLRSLIDAHADPYDHRSLEWYAEMKGRGDELVTLPHLCQRDKDFSGPFQAPSTALFNEFHDVLARGYGVHDIVEKGTVKSINPVPDDGEPIFQVSIDYGTETKCSPQIVRARRVVCCMGPIFTAREAFWEASLKRELVGQAYPSHRILHPREIVPHLMSQESKPQQDCHQAIQRLLIVGGGITSAQLALRAAKAPWCDSVKLIQRSRAISRQFDIENKWMGPRRGQLLDKFWSLGMPERARMLQKARLGGSIPPEILKELRDCHNAPSIGLEVQEEVQISDVSWDGNKFRTTLDDGSDTEEYDMIWLATGSENNLDSYSALSDLRKILPIDVVGGLPVVDKDLSWRRPEGLPEENEHEWKTMARKRLWCMGSLAGLELGPDALNLIGGRHGAVRVATAIREEMKKAT